MHRLILGVLFLAFFVSLCGCQTIKAIGKGLAADTDNTWTAIKKADSWFRENYW